MSELPENKDLKSNKSDEFLNARESVDRNKSVGHCRDILFCFNPNNLNLDDKYSQKIKQTYDFVNFVYGKSNTERLSKIIDKVVKRDMKFFENKTDEDITDWQRQKNPRYRFEDSLYGGMRRRNDMNLAELMLWHMTLLDILNLKCYDLKLDKSLEESIEDAVARKSTDRLDFLCGNHRLNFDYTNFYGEILYKYSKRVFEELPKEQQRPYEYEDEDEDDNFLQRQGQLMKKIFSCFIKVAFCNMEQLEKPEYYKNFYHHYIDHRTAILNLTCYFFRQGNFYCNKKDIATYLFYTDELETMFENYNRDFFCFLGWAAVDTFEFWFFLNKIKPLEQRYAENKDRFIKMFFSRFLIHRVEINRDYELSEAIANILPYFVDEKLRLSLVADMAQEWNTDYNQLLDSLNLIEKSNEKSELRRKRSKRESKLSLPEQAEQTNYFRDIIERFTDGANYSNALVESMSMMICRNGNIVIDNQKDDKNNNKPPERSNIIENVNGSVDEEEKENKKEKAEKKAKSENDNNKTTAKAENKIENSKKNWFFRFVCVVLGFFSSIGSKISNFFCGQPEEIDSGKINSNSVVEDININGIKSQSSKTPEIDNLNTEEQKNI